MPAIGECKLCRGALAVSGNKVACLRCGRPFPDHPKSKEIAEAVAQQKAAQQPQPPPPVPKASQVADAARAAVEARLEALEKAGKK